SVDCRALLRQSRDSRESIARLGDRLSYATQSSSALVAIDSVEPWLALIAGSHDSPGQLAEQFWRELYSRLRHCPVECVLNLHGGLLQGANVDRGAGPLFRDQPSQAEREFAEALSHELLGRFDRDHADWPHLRVDWHWQPLERPGQSALRQRVLRI